MTRALRQFKTTSRLESSTSSSRKNLQSGTRTPSQDVEALSPGIEDDLTSAKFTLSRNVLHKLIEERNPESIRQLGGLSGVAKALRTDLKIGLSADEDGLERLPDTALHELSALGSAFHLGQDQQRKSGFTDRKTAYGDNRLPPRRPKSFLRLIWDAFNDKLMFLLAFSAVVSLALGIYQSVNPSEPGSNVEWVEGVTIVIAIIIILMATATNDWQKNHKFEKLNAKKSERYVNVVRSGKLKHISVFDLLVGDLVHLETGDIVPVDGILAAGYDVECDESSVTGESDLIRKTPWNDDHLAEDASKSQDHDPFILSGSKVSSGVGTMLVTSVGVNSSYGRILMSLRDEPQETPLQQKLGSLSKYILFGGCLFGLVFFFILFVRFLVRLPAIEGGPRAKGEEFLEIFMLSVTMVVIGVPEGLALAVTLALAFATTRMLKDNNLVRLLRSCETMGNATTICSDKTGTLTQNKMTVVSCRLGIPTEVGQFGAQDENKIEKVNALYDDLDDPMSSKGLTASLKELLCESIALNTTATERNNPEEGDLLGSSTEVALIRFAYDRLGLRSLTELREQMPIVHLFPFDPRQKIMAVVIRLSNGGYRIYAKGAAEIVVSRCSTSIKNHGAKGETIAIDGPMRSRLDGVVSVLAQKSLRPLALAYRDIDRWPLHHNNEETDVNKSPSLEDHVQAMSFIAVVGLRDPLRQDVVNSVRQCQVAGVFVRMVTGDNFDTAKSIALECGIYTAGGVAIDGPTFRNLDSAQLDLILPRLQVLARSSPEDKRILVHRLRAQKEIVAVTGDGTNDALALKAADVGFAMGIAGTDVAKEASSIILMDDNFASIVKALLWGRTINDAVKKFLQFQLTINFGAGLLTAVTALVGGSDDAVFSVVQLLWVNIIMDTFAALSLATDYPTRGVLHRKPEPRGTPVITVSMWKMVLAQSMYQMTVIFILHYGGHAFFAHDSLVQQQRLQTTAFNTYIFMQVFNQTNCRRADSGLNIFEGVLRNPWFFFVQAVTITGQLLIVMFGGNAFQTERPTGAQWATSIVLGLITLPYGAVVRLTPNRWFLWIVKPVRILFHLRMKHRQTKAHRKATSPPKPNLLQRAVSGFRREAIPPNLLLPTVEHVATSGKRQVAPDHSPMRSFELPVNDTSKIDLSELVRLAKSHQPYLGHRFELHPETHADDPVLIPLPEDSRSQRIPPSQDPVYMRYLGSLSIASAVVTDTK